MSKQVEGMRRMLLILNKLRPGKRFIPRRELLDYVNDSMEERYGYQRITGRTLERDIADIDELFGIGISFNRTRQGYFIREIYGDYDERVCELMMNFDLLNALDRDQNLSTFVLAEHHRPLYSEWLMPLVRAIHDLHPVEFDYVDYRNDSSEKYFSVLPHYLKESNQRWYLLAYDGAVMKTFGVDRIRCLGVLEDETFERNTDISVDDLFSDCSACGTTRTFPSKTSNCAMTRSTDAS